MRLSDAAAQAWPPFVLVTGLLLVGLVAHADGLFAHAGRTLERIPGSAVVLLLAPVAAAAALAAAALLTTSQ